MTCGTGQDNSKTGAQTLMGYENSSCESGSESPLNTALDLTAYTDSKICCKIEPKFTSEELIPESPGCGGNSGLGTDANVGNKTFRFGLSGEVGFQNGFDRLFAQFLGESSAATEITSGEGDYAHLLSFASSANQHFGTLAYELTSTDVMEAKSAFVSSIKCSITKLGQYMKWAAELLATGINLTGYSAPVNSNADLASLAFVDNELAIPQVDTQLLIKAIDDDGADTALSSSTDKFAFTSLDFEFRRTLEPSDEITGGSPNEPVEKGAPIGTLTVNVAKHSDLDRISYINWLNGHIFCAQLAVLGSTIGAGQKKAMIVRFPKLVLVDAPGYNVVDKGKNPYSLVFRVLDAENAIPFPTTNGVTGASYSSPNVSFVNQRDSDYLVD